jgi:Ser/Thr protein kinase RdoA (MazF antagonist)
MHNIELVVAQYDVGVLRKVGLVGSGLIHRTYRVETDRGVYVLQRLHEVISNKAIEDMNQVTRHVMSEGIRAPALLKTKAGTFVAEYEGVRWRLYPWIDGAVVDAVTTKEMAHEAGRIVGDLHRALASLPYVPQGSIPHFHDTEYVLQELAAVQGELPPEVFDIGKQIAELLPRAIVGVEAGPKQLIHGDLKISNMIFSGGGGDRFRHSAFSLQNNRSRRRVPLVVQQDFRT